MFWKVLLVLCACLIPLAWQKAAIGEQAGGARPNAVSPVYKPPVRGAPATRVGGGTRNPTADDLVMYVLAPEETGLTTREQPTLYWYISKRAPAKVEISLIDDSSILPLLETTVAEVAKPGIQALDLAEHGIRLKPGVEYRWSVAVIRNPDHRSNDIVASGGIKMTETPKALANQLAEGAEDAKVAIYAEAGIWYDALMCLIKLIDGDPMNETLQAQRSELLKQVGLPVAPK